MVIVTASIHKEISDPAKGQGLGRLEGFVG
jgi:hypothetical protein